MPENLQNYETMKLLVDLLRRELDLPADRVVLYNQQWELPDDDGILIEISFLGEKPFGQGTHYEEGTDPDDSTKHCLFEVNEQVTQELLGITIYSKGPDARARRHEIQMALAGTRAQQMAEKYSFKFGFLPTGFTDASETEGSARLNKFVYLFHVLRIHARRRIVQYFDTFQNPPTGLIVSK